MRRRIRLHIIGAKGASCDRGYRSVAGSGVRGKEKGDGSSASRNLSRRGHGSMGVKILQKSGCRNARVCSLKIVQSAMQQRVHRKEPLVTTQDT